MFFKYNKLKLKVSKFIKKVHHQTYYSNYTQVVIIFMIIRMRNNWYFISIQSSIANNIF